MRRGHFTNGRYSAFGQEGHPLPYLIVSYKKLSFELELKTHLSVVDV